MGLAKVLFVIWFCKILQNQIINKTLPSLDTFMAVITAINVSRKICLINVKDGNRIVENQ